MSAKIVSGLPQLAALEDRFAAGVIRALDHRTEALPFDISERLRFARQLAVDRVPLSRLSSATNLGYGSGAAVLGGAGRWGWRIASALPFAVLVLGLVSIHSWQQSSQIDAAAEVDAALLSDALPPTAYSDPGFVEYLKQRDR